ncbi:MAG: hypothetical protein NWQ19_04555 [Nonlabens sp.]|nr:hypothetical protein [Nonlabens sp.]
MRNLLILVLTFLLSQLIVAQNYVDDKPVVQAQGLSSQNAQFNFVSNNLTTNQPNSNSQQNGNSNAIFIEQVGVGNIVDAQIISNNSQVYINQEGGNNFTGLRLNAQNITQNINQIGFGNTVLDYSMHGAINHQVGVNQQGNYNTTISTGRNSISERLQVNQRGTGSTVLVIHY